MDQARSPAAFSAPSWRVLLPLGPAKGPRRARPRVEGQIRAHVNHLFGSQKHSNSISAPLYCPGPAGGQPLAEDAHWQGGRATKREFQSAARPPAGRRSLQLDEILLRSNLFLPDFGRLSRRNCFTSDTTGLHSSRPGCLLATSGQCGHPGGLKSALRSAPKAASKAPAFGH